MKETRTWSVVLFVDSANKKEFQKLPPKLKTKVSNLSGKYIPKIHFTSADLSQDFGSFHHTQMRSQNFRDLFRETKKKVREAKKEGLLSSTSAKADEPNTDEDTDSIVTIENPSLSDWKSAKGSTIKAKLLRIEEQETYVFQTASGKTLKVKKEQLDVSSIEKAQQLVAEQS